MRALIRRASVFLGEVPVPGDKSLSHRALILGALSSSPCRITHLSPGHDVRTTARCLQALGVPLTLSGTTATLQRPTDFASSVRLDCGNSGTTMRLLSGLVAGLNLEATLWGDESLSRRPMRRIVEPLSKMGARIECSAVGGPPVQVHARRGALQGVDFDLEIASAQVKSGLLLAGLFAEGKTRIREPFPTRDHTERMLRAMGADITCQTPNAVSLTGASQALSLPPELPLPGDPSSAAFLLAAAVLHPTGRVCVRGVTLNPRRLGFVDVLSRMGAHIELLPRAPDSFEPVGDLLACGTSALKACDILPEDIPSVIDELPLLAVVATQARGRTRIRGAQELRVKESDRLSNLARGLKKMGAHVEEFPDGLDIEGPVALTGQVLDSAGDHRLAMCWTLAGLSATDETVVENAEWADVSFPGFFEVMGTLSQGAVTTLEHR